MIQNPLLNRLHVAIAADNGLSVPSAERKGEIDEALLLPILPHRRHRFPKPPPLQYLNAASASDP